MWKKNQSSVLVVGAGPVGLAAALSLCKEGMDFEIVDKSSGPCTHSKACMLSPETLEFLEELDVLDAVLAKAVKIHAIQLFDASNRLANVSLGELPASHPFIASIPQMDLEEILVKRLHHFHKKVLWNHRVSAVHRLRQGLCVEVDRLSEHMMGYAVMHEEKLVDSTITFLPKVLLAADGLHSLIRRLDKIKYEVVGDDLVSLLFEVRRNPREDAVLKIGFSKEGTSAYVPLPHGLGRYGFTVDKVKEYSADRDSSHLFYDEDLDKFPELSETNFHKLVNRRMPYLTGQVKEILWRASVPFGVRLAESIWGNGIFLLGDAARSGFPVGAKSLNLGMPEAGAVVKALIPYLKNGGDGELVEQAGRIRMEWEDLASMVYFESKSEKKSASPAVDPNVILQALPLTGDSLEYVAEKLTKHLASHCSLKV